MFSLILILGDQLSHGVSSLKDCDKAADTVLICEVWEEATYVRHHKKKIAFLFSAMRHFAAELTEQGYAVRYRKLDDPLNAGSFRGEIERELAAKKYDRIVVTFPGEYRVAEDMKTWAEDFGIAVEIRPDDRFLCSVPAFKNWASRYKSGLRMEFFYREMRRQYGILMDGEDPENKPEGGHWNYDAENRKVPEGGQLLLPKPSRFTPDDITREVLELVAEKFAGHFGDLEPFALAVTRAQALKVLEAFIVERLPLFGDYQDAMLEGSPYLYHSHLSFYINCGLLSPLEVIRAAEDAYRRGDAPLNSAEGFIRQILGWREFIRGVYWLRMPDFKTENFLDATRKLPWFYWSAETEMNCLHHCVKDTKEHAYAHHIQRLMVLGNFALLAGIHPDEVNEWYMIVHADAYEWVELPNVSGMILFADGGGVASKPYAASGAYINKMSDYCRNCRYDVKKKNGPDACPFNYLYWDFMVRHKDKLAHNPRLAFTYKALGRMDSGKVEAAREDAKRFLDKLELGVLE